VGSKLLLSIFGILYLLVLGDCVSTYFCLTVEAPGYSIYEANPLSEAVFSAVGMMEGLALMAGLKALGLVVLYKMAMNNTHTYLLIAIGMACAALITLLVNVNNWYILYVVTQSP
jgi:hypothetical protein